MATTTIGEGEIKNRHIADGAAIERDKMEQRVLGKQVIHPQEWRVWDAVATVLPGTPASDDLGYVTGTFATSPSYIGTGDLKNAGSTSRYARALVALPEDYEAGETVTIRAWAGMITTVASSAATIDFEVWRVDYEDGTLGSADLCATAATSINSLTEDDKDFEITAATLNPGDLLDIRMTILVNDSGTGTAVIGACYQVYLLSDRR